MIQLSSENSNILPVVLFSWHVNNGFQCFEIDLFWRSIVSYNLEKKKKFKNFL